MLTVANSSYIGYNQHRTFSKNLFNLNVIKFKIYTLHNDLHTGKYIYVYVCVCLYIYIQDYFKIFGFKRNDNDVLLENLKINTLMGIKS